MRVLVKLIVKVNVKQIVRLLVYRLVSLYANHLVIVQMKLNHLKSVHLLKKKAVVLKLVNKNVKVVV